MTVAGIRVPVAALSRLRRSRAVSESNPRSWKAGPARWPPVPDGRARWRPGRGPARRGHGPVRRRAARPAARPTTPPRCPDRAGPGSAPGPAVRAAVARWRSGAQRCQVEAGRYEDGVRGGQRGVEEHRHLVVRDGATPERAIPGQVGVVEVMGHATGRGQQSPGQRVGHQALGAPVFGEGVEEHVGGRVVALAAAAHDGAGGGEHHERGGSHLAGQPVQVPCRVELRGEYGVEPLGGQRGDHAVVQHSGGVDDGRQRVRGGDRGEQTGQCVRIGDVAGGDPHVRAQVRPVRR
jgi:hypothetical protein